MDKIQAMLEIKRIMEQQRGKGNQISAGEIAKRLGLKEEDTHVEPRQLILETIETHQVPIAAGGKGYYLLTNEEELSSYVKTLDNRIKKIERRKRNVIDIFKKYKPKAK